MTETASGDRRPASRRIADKLRRSIESGDLAPGAQLPSERQLAATYGTARNTAREAIRLLADSGLVIAEQGRGAFVRRSAPLIRLGNDRYTPKYRDSGLSPFLLECAKQGKTGRFKDGALSGVASPSRKTTPLTILGPRSAAIPTSAAPAEWPTRTGAFVPVSLSVLTNARIWPARWAALNGGLDAL
ncbi:MAG TPA: winged helix-turn-helix domain-containing protein [Streptosporangiaceae bacterium]